MSLTPPLFSADISRVAYNNIDGYASLVPDADAAASNLAAGKGFFRDEGPSFDDVLDLVNPLHHIPIVGTLYRAVTGDTISTGVRLAGGALFGGPLGFVSAIANAAFTEATGKDVGEQLLALAGFGPGTSPAETIAVAQSGELAGQTASVAALSAPGAASGNETPTSPAASIPPTLFSPPGLQDKAALARSRSLPASDYDRQLLAALLGANDKLGAQRARNTPLPLPAAIAERDNGKPATPLAPARAEDLSAEELAQRLVLYTQARSNVGGKGSPAANPF